MKSRFNILLLAFVFAPMAFPKAAALYEHPGEFFQTGDNSSQPQDPEPAKETPAEKALDHPADVPPPSYGQQPKRILGVLPNLRAVGVGDKVPQPTLREKFWLATENSFDYSAFLSLAFQTSIQMAEDSYPALGHGLSGFGQNYWRMLLDRTSGQYITNAILPAITHEDTRYYTLGKGRWYKRAIYAYSRVLITPNDQGRNTFNISEIVGKGAAAALGNVYYPGGFNMDKTLNRWVFQVGFIDGPYAVFREFWPDIATHVLHQHQKPQGD